MSAIRRYLFHLPGRFLASFLGVLLVTSPYVCGQPVPATHKQGSLHGFLLLKSEDGKVIAIGDQINDVHGDEVRSSLVFHFHDGSIDDETATFRQGSVFHLLRDHHIQKGPSFPEPLDMTVNVPAGEVTWREIKDGKKQVKTEHMDLPADLVNGMMSLVAENFPAKTAEWRTSYLTLASKPRVVHSHSGLTAKTKFWWGVPAADRTASMFISISVEWQA